MENNDGYELENLKDAFQKLASHDPGESGTMEYLYGIYDIMKYYEEFPGPDTQDVIIARVKEII